MIQERVAEIEKVFNKYNEKLEEGVSREDIAEFLEWINNNCNDIDMFEYIEFMKKINGLDFNGLVIYALGKNSDNNLYDMNEDWHEEGALEGYIVFGDSDISWYCFDLDKKEFCELDKPSEDIIKNYKSFNEMSIDIIDIFFKLSD